MRAFKVERKFPTLGKRFLQMIFSVCLGVPICAQSTIRFGFEEFQIKDVPPFVTPIGTGSASIEDSSSSAFSSYHVTPVEGQKFLLLSQSNRFASPNGEAIESFSMNLFVPRTYLASDNWSISIGNKTFNIGNGGAWHTVQATFDSPVQNFPMTAFWSFETVPSSVAIDAVEFITVPEPGTIWLLTLSFAAIAFHQRKRSKAIAKS